MESPLLTVAEAAELLRLAPQTIYRWCRSGKLPAVKLGKEWRIPLAQVQRSRGPSRRLPLPEVFPALAEEHGHIMGVVEDELAVGRMAALFAESAAGLTGRLVYLRWTEERSEVQQWLRPAIAPEHQESKLRIIDMAEAYERQGIGSVDAMLDPIMKTGERYCGLSSAFGYFSRYSDRLAQLETRYQALLKDRPCGLLCLYALADMDTTRAMPSLVRLMEQHDAVVFFDGEYALVLRPRT